MQNSAVILAGGSSKRFGQDKALIELANKPLILHVVDKASKIVEEIVVVVGSETQKETFARFLSPEARVVADNRQERGPLVGAMAGFESAQGEYSLLLPCDTPFISREIILFLLDLRINKTAVIPRWPSGHIEPLQAVYHTRSALTAAKTALEEGKLDLQSMIAHLRGVRYVSTLVLQQIDPKLLTFFNINSFGDLKNAESMLKTTSKRK